MLSLWFNTQSGTHVEGNTFPLPNDLSDPSVRDVALDHMDQGWFRVRGAPQDGLTVEGTCPLSVVTDVLRPWLIRRTDNPRVHLRNLRTGEAVDTTGDRIVTPRTHHRCAAALQAKTRGFVLTDLLDASTPAEIHRAALLYVLEWARMLEGSSIFLIAPKTATPTTELSFAQALCARNTCRWTSRKIIQGEVQWVSAAYAYANADQGRILDMVRCLQTPAVYFHNAKDAGVALSADRPPEPISLQDTEGISRSLGDVFFDITGAGSMVNNILIQSYGWNPIPEFRRPWEESPVSLLTVKGRGYHFR